MLLAGVTDDVYDQVVSTLKSINFGPGKLYTCDLKFIYLVCFDKGTIQRI